MRRLLALMICAVSLGAAAQFPSLPYNPDENGDGLIGVVDLQGLLSNYGNEFAGAVVSEDGESAIVYMGEMAYSLCSQSCKNLPGRWDISTIVDLGLVWSDVAQPDGSGDTWLCSEVYFGADATPTKFQYFNSDNVFSGSSPINSKRCYCAAKQLPRVEYSVCGSNSNNTMSATAIQLCCEQKVAEGWMPLGGVAQASYSASQAFWRWAE